MESDIKSSNILLYGGGGCHDFASICPVLKTDLESIPGVSVHYVQNDPEALHADALEPFDTIVVYHTGGDLDLAARRGLVEGVAGGKGFIGVHSAADSFKNAPEYLAMIGGVFIGHPFRRSYTVALTDPAHPITRDFEGYAVKDWERWPCFEYQVEDEQYLLDYDPRVHVLASAIYSGTLPKAHPHGIAWPVAWTKSWGRGRVFYLALGHDVDAVRTPFFERFFRNGARWIVTPPEE